METSVDATIDFRRNRRIEFHLHTRTSFTDSKILFDLINASKLVPRMTRSKNHVPRRTRWNAWPPEPGSRFLPLLHHGVSLRKNRGAGSDAMRTRLDGGSRRFLSRFDRRASTVQGPREKERRLPFEPDRDCRSKGGPNRPDARSTVIHPCGKNLLPRLRGRIDVVPSTGGFTPRLVLESSAFGRRSESHSAAAFRSGRNRRRCSPPFLRAFPSASCLERDA